MSLVRRLWPFLLALAALASAYVAWATFQTADTNTRSADEPEPTTRTATVAVGDVRSVVVLSGVVLPAEDIEVRAPGSGRVAELSGVAGEMTLADQEVATIETEMGTRVDVVADEAGTLNEWMVSVGSTVRPGDTLALLSPDRFEAAAVVPPELLYRFYGEDLGVTAVIDHGPAPFTCPLVSLGAGSGASSTDATVELRCAIPSTVRVFPGVRLKVAVVTGEARDALVLPLESVAGEADQGFVTVIDSSGSVATRSVRLGMTDGLRVQILDGLSEGDLVLVPPDVDLLSP